MEIETAINECVGALMPARAKNPDRALQTVIHRITMAHGEGPLDRELLKRVPDMRIWTTMGQKKLAARIINALTVAAKPGESPDFALDARAIMRTNAEDDLRRGVPPETILAKTGRSSKWLKRVALSAGIEAKGVNGNRGRRQETTLQAEKLLREGLSAREVGEKVGLSQQWVRQIGLRAGIEMGARPTRTRSPASYEAEKLLRAGASTVEAQEKTGLTMVTIRSLAKTLGVRATSKQRTADRLDEAKALLAKGMDGDAIAEKLGMPRRAVLRLARLQGVKVKRRSRFGESTVKAKALFEANTPLPEIAAQTGLSIPYLRNYAKRHGLSVIPSPYRSEAQKIAMEAMKAGATAEEACQKSGLTLGVVKKYHRQLGLAPPPRKVTKSTDLVAKKAEAEKLLREGMVVTETAAATGLSISTVRRLGVEINVKNPAAPGAAKKTVTAAAEPSAPRQPKNGRPKSKAASRPRPTGSRPTSRQGGGKPSRAAAQ